jgi:hypothetical protein
MRANPNLPETATRCVNEVALREGEYCTLLYLLPLPFGEGVGGRGNPR